MEHNCLHVFTSAISQCLFFLPRAISALMRLSDWGVMNRYEAMYFSGTCCSSSAFSSSRVSYRSRALGAPLLSSHRSISKISFS